jgi:glycosyltransferase involved in cell wall biosynthesis
MPAILASADLLLALLEEHAGPMAVPSKVLTYLCAGRPILGAIPGDNLAARVILEAGAGRVVAPGDSFLFDEAARAILEDREGAQSMGAAARAYAERTFEIEMIGPKFESLFNDALLSRRQG